jgi:hypothetical protein
MNLGWIIACVLEVVGTFLWREGVEKLSDGGTHRFDGPRRCRACHRRRLSAAAKPHACIAWLLLNEGIVGHLFNAERELPRFTPIYLRFVPQRRCINRSHGENRVRSASRPMSTMTAMVPMT